MRLCVKARGAISAVAVLGVGAHHLALVIGVVAPTLTILITLLRLFTCQALPSPPLALFDSNHSSADVLHGRGCDLMDLVRRIHPPFFPSVCTSIAGLLSVLLPLR